MAESLTNLILLRIEQAKTVGAGIAAVLDEAVAGYDQFLAPVVADGEPSVDIRRHMELLRRKVDFHVETLQGFDMGVLSKTSDTDFLRTELGVLTGEVSGKMRRVTDIARGVYGPESLVAIGLNGRTPQVPLRLYERGRRAQSILRDPDLKLRPKAGLVLGPDGETSLFTPPALADELEPDLTDLGLIVDTRFEDNREETIVRLHRRRAVKDFDLGLRGILRIVQGTLIAAGREDLAKRFRSTVRRAARQQGLSLPGEGQPGDSQQGEGQQGQSREGEGQQGRSQQSDSQNPPVDASTSPGV